MTLPARAIGAAGLALAVTALCYGQSARQNDGAIQKTDAAAADATAPVLPAKIGTVDMDKVFREYKKLKFQYGELNAEAAGRSAELKKMSMQGQQLVKELESLDSNSNDFKAKRAKITQLKAQIDSEQEQARVDIARREAEVLAGIYKEVQELCATAARQKRLTFVVKISRDPISGADPESVMRAMARTVVYSDPSADLTDMIIYNLNRFYQAKVDAGAEVGPAATEPGRAPVGAPPRTPPAGAGATTKAAAKGDTNRR
jgi:outer membrane protein